MTNHDHPLTPLTDLRLSPEAKARIRADLSAYADFHTIAPKTRRVASGFSLNRHLLSLYGARMLSVFLVVGIFSGTAAASTNALPGDVLYPVKVRVAEPVQTALITSAAGKATWQASLAERRLEEATRLAVELRLSPETEQELATSFEEHVQDSLASAEAVEQSGDIITSLEVRSALEAKVTAHKTILERVVDQLPDTAGNATSPAEGLLQVVSDTRAVVTAERVDAEVALATASTSGDTVATTMVATEATDVGADSAVSDTAAAPSVIASADPVSDAQIAQTTVAREQEIASILEKHSDLLETIAATPDGSTATATSSATTTLPLATTTPSDLATTTPILLPAAGAPLEVLRGAPTLRQNLNPQRLP